MSDPTTTPAAPAGIDPERYYTLGVAARLTGFGRDTLVARCDAGVLPCVRAPGLKASWRRVRGSDLLAFLAAAGAKVPAPPPPADPPPAPRRRNTFAADNRRALKELGLA